LTSSTSSESASSSAGGLLAGLDFLGKMPVRRDATTKSSSTSATSSAAGLLGGLDPPKLPARDTQNLPAGDFGLGAFQKLPINGLGSKSTTVKQTASSLSIGGSVTGLSVTSVPALPLRRDASETTTSSGASTTSSAAGLLAGLPGLGGLKREEHSTMPFSAHTIAASVMQSIQHRQSHIEHRSATGTGSDVASATASDTDSASATPSGVADGSAGFGGLASGLQDGAGELQSGLEGNLPIRREEYKLPASITKHVHQRDDTSTSTSSSVSASPSAAAGDSPGLGMITNLLGGAGGLRVRDDSSADSTFSSTSNSATASASSAAEDSLGMGMITNLLGGASGLRARENTSSSPTASSSSSSATASASSSAGDSLGLGQLTNLLGGVGDLRVRNAAAVTSKPTASATVSTAVSATTQTDAPNGVFGQGLTSVTDGSAFDGLDANSLPDAGSLQGAAGSLPIRARADKQASSATTISATENASPSSAPATPSASSAGGLGGVTDILSKLGVKRQDLGLGQVHGLAKVSSLHNAIS